MPKKCSLKASTILTIDEEESRHVLQVLDTVADEYDLPDPSRSRNGRTVASLVLHYLSLIIFADNPLSQNENVFFMSALSLIAVKSLYGTTNVRVSFIVVRYAQFRPDWCFGVLNAEYLILRSIQYMTSQRTFFTKFKESLRDSWHEWVLTCHFVDSLSIYVEHVGESVQLHLFRSQLLQEARWSLTVVLCRIHARPKIQLAECTFS